VSVLQGPFYRDIAFKILRELNEFGKALIIATLDMTFANSCDRIIHL
jgi:ABC-type lipoprotein export system ATPase subunit